MLVLQWLQPMPTHAMGHHAGVPNPQLLPITPVQLSPAPAPTEALACCQSAACAGLGCPLPVAQPGMPGQAYPAAWLAQSGAIPEGQPPEPWPRPPRRRV
jgi:hypothetical protein